MHDIKIDYIIPCYYEENNLRRSLEALSKQTRKDALKVIVVNDCSPNTPCGYQDVVDEYRDRLDITLVKTDCNSGPGLTKQLGIDSGTSDYFMIQDDDDEIASDDVIEGFIKVIEEHKSDNNIASILGDTGLCDDNFNIYEVHRDSFEHGRLFYRKFMQEHNIRYTYELSLLFDDAMINDKITLVIINDNFQNIQLDKLCYLYRTGLKGSVSNSFTRYMHLYKYIALDMELLKFNDSVYGLNTDARVYKCISKKLFDIMLIMISLHSKYNILDNRVWNTLRKYRWYLLDKIDVGSCNYMEDAKLFNNYRHYLFGLNDYIEYVDFIIDIDIDVKEQLYYTYLSGEKTIFNCDYNEINELLKGE